MIYTTGTIAVSGKTVTGTGTEFNAALSMIRVGCTLIAISNPVQIFSITEVKSATSLSVTPAASPSIPAGTKFSILLSDSISVDGLAQDVAETLRYYQGKESEIADAVEFFSDNKDVISASKLASQSATTATNAATTATSAADSAKTYRDEAHEYANQTAKPYAYVLQPLPDVWIPFNDSLDMITGYGQGTKKVTIDGEEKTISSDKVVSFSRASTATYIDKSGAFTIADINEPRFEKEGLLIEGQRTNYFANSNAPESWNPNSGLNRSETKTDSRGFKYATFTPGGFIGESGAYTVIAVNVQDKIAAVKNDEITISFRAKGNNVRFIARFDKGDPLTTVASAYIDSNTLDVSTSGTDKDNIVSKNVVSDGEWVAIEIVYKVTDDSTYIRGVIQMSNKYNTNLDNTSFMDLTTPQVELGSCASSFIISGSAPATRTSDIVLLPIPKNYATQPISLLMEVNLNWGPLNKMPNIEGSARLVNVSVANETTEIGDESYMYFGFTSQGSRLIITNGKGTKTEYKAYCATPGNKFVAGFRFDANRNLQAFANGATEASSQSGHTKQTYKDGNINIGGQSSSGNRHLFGHVRNFRIWHKALTDSQLSEVV
ncbi:phage head spike fiber domain-containing protein [Escherichia coli]|uniref:phage head spike fiber domain-containing protein n=1 Tax=Escherichia coli TaxID=562 RepID=UPI0017979B4A|nr:LamG domain-containing protein [Escherichia coli]HAL1420748.1 LamG domain-containing protein [Escherichia coli]